MSINTRIPLVSRILRLVDRLSAWHRSWRSYKAPRHIHVGSEPLPGIDYEEPLKS